MATPPAVKIRLKRIRLPQNPSPAELSRILRTMQDYTRDALDQIEKNGAGQPGAQGPAGAAGAAGAPGAPGKVVGQKFIQTGAYMALVNQVHFNDTAALGTDGTEILKISYAAASALNSIHLRGVIIHSIDATFHTIGFLNVDGGAAVAEAWASSGGPNLGMLISVEAEFLAGDTASHDYRLRGGPATVGGPTTMYVNGAAFVGPGRLFGGVASTTLQLLETTP